MYEIQYCAKIRSVHGLARKGKSFPGYGGLTSRFAELGVVPLDIYSADAHGKLTEGQSHQYGLEMLTGAVSLIVRGNLKNSTWLSPNNIT